MFVAGSEFTKKLDQMSIEKYKTPELILMENACNAALTRILKEDGDKNKFLFICGFGNNGGDGFGIAKKLFNKGYDINIVTIGNSNNMSLSCKTNYEICSSYNIPFLHIENKNELEKFINKCRDIDVLVDCIFGSGLNRNIDGLYYKLIESINISKKDQNFKIISIDIPSGLNGTNGDIMNICVESDYTITFEFYKKGFLRYGNEKYTGNIFVEDIDIYYKIYNELNLQDCFMDENYVLDNLIVKNDYSNKGEFGKVCMFASSPGFYGAGYISTQSCVKTGSGLTTLVSTKDVIEHLSIKLNEAMTCNFLDQQRLEKLLKKIDAVGFGPGLGNNKLTLEMLSYILKNTKSTIVIDADGLNILSQYNYLDSLKQVENDIILTPHIAEFSRLSNISIEDINKDRIETSKEFARKNEVILVLKGKNTIITDGYRTNISPTGNNAMANGGMGDCLTGIITSLCGQGYDAFTAASIGVYLHGECADQIHQYKQVVNATDIIKNLPLVLKMYYKKLELLNNK